jgi:hypothetical protein
MCASMKREEFFLHETDFSSFLLLSSLRMLNTEKLFKFNLITEAAAKKKLSIRKVGKN